MGRMDIHVDEGGIEVPREDEVEGDAAWVRSGGGGAAAAAAAAAVVAWVIFVLEGVGPFSFVFLSHLPNFILLLPPSLPFLRMKLGHPSSLLLLRVSFSGGKGFLSFLLRLLLCG
jgi:hypothetical protein